MFLDGVTYAAIARNQAENRGGFWNPHYSETVYPEFFEQPPLGIWLQSQAFRVFGDSTNVEFFWGVGCGLIILLLMLAIWRTVYRDHGAAPGAWWPAAIFLLMPLSTWTLANNLLENTMTCFILLGAWAGWVALSRRTWPAQAAWASFSGLMLALAMLSKGFPAAFILAIPMTVAGMRRHSFAAAFRITAVTALSTLLGLWLVYAAGGEAATRFAGQYFSSQVLRSLKGQREVSGSPVFLLTKLLMELSVPFLIAFIFTYFLRRREPGAQSAHGPGRGPAAFFTAIALMASLPLLVSPKQMGWYLFPSLPFWAMAIAAALPLPGVKLEAILSCNPGRLKKIVLAALVIFMAAAGGALIFKGTMARRNPELFADLAVLPAWLPPGQTVTVYPQQLVADWYVVAYMQRFLRASLTATAGNRYCLVDGSAVAAAPPGYRPLASGKHQRYFLCVNDLLGGKPMSR